MKKILLAGAMMLGLAFGANAQKGSVLVYGNTTFGTQSNDGPTNFSLNPGVGYQFNNNWTVGLDLGMGVQNHATPSYQAGAFLRYTQPINGTFAIYEQLGLGYLKNGEANGFNPYGLLSENNLPEAAGSKGFYGVISLPNVFINVKNGFGVNLGFGNVGFASTKPDGDGAKSTSKFSFNFGHGVSIGISKNFGGKK